MAGPFWIQPIRYALAYLASRMVLTAAPGFDVSREDGMFGNVQEAPERGSGSPCPLTIRWTRHFATALWLLLHF